MSSDTAPTGTAHTDLTQAAPAGTGLAETPARDLTGTALTTGRLVLSAPGEQDIDRLAELCQDPAIAAWTTVPSPYTRADAEHFVREMVAGGMAAGTDAVFALRHATTGELLGMTGLHGIAARSDRRTAHAELGYWMAPQARGHGYITEAARAVCRWGFAELGLERIDWMAFVGNDGSRRVAEKVGFTIEGVQRRRHVQKGRVVDTWIGSLLPGELR
ncbi:MAG TPA: GNAT family protein [Actinocrinis sp.]|nr:GNAT family protein [Actinocrinis sp.]